ncbi:MAG: hypothetical protein GTO02_20380 [Candidatus Dadabacteria bacterium]|nr:hypothetical protein [Candidatus Dadabacteria bacterium]NIQ16654.1 hypothetical protein [Candidatus Dadabacteria bacterium]
MRYLNLFIILAVLGCYSGLHPSNFVFKEDSKSSCHTIMSADNNHHNVLNYKFQSEENQNKKSCCVEALTHKLDQQIDNPAFVVSVINYHDIYNIVRNKFNYSDKNLNNHSPPKLFISKSSFLI